MTAGYEDSQRGWVAILGAGSWGTTLAKVFADAGNEVRLWVRREGLAARMEATRCNEDYLPGIILPDNGGITTDVEQAGARAEALVLAVPSQTLRANLKAWREFFPAQATVVSVAKGVEAGTGKLMTQVIEEAAGIDPARIAVITGPNLAKEIALEQPAATVVACTDAARAQRLQQALATDYLRPYTNTDVIGCELGGSCKNVIALACGIAAGRGLGENSAATVITRGLAEITRLGQALGADPRTFSGLAGLGDLVATCSLPLSRNRTFGQCLGAGGTLDSAMQATHGQVAEGVTSSKSVFELARAHGVDMPMTQAVYAVCHEGMTVEDMIVALMGRSKKAE